MPARLSQVCYGVCLFLLIGFLSGCNIGYSIPPQSLETGDLTGVWIADYGTGVERLLLNPDGSFHQTYHESTGHEVMMESKGQWYLEKFDNGTARIFLQGGRYYAAGSEFVDRDAFYDPYLNQGLIVDNGFYLHVRQDRTHRLLLYHLFLNADEGFPIIGMETLTFRLVSDK